MQMLHSNWLSYRSQSAINVERLKFLHIMATFTRFSNASEEDLETLLDN